MDNELEKKPKAVNRRQLLKISAWFVAGAVLAIPAFRRGLKNFNPDEDNIEGKNKEQEGGSEFKKEDNLAEGEWLRGWKESEGGVILNSIIPMETGDGVRVRTLYFSELINRQPQDINTSYEEKPGEREQFENVYQEYFPDEHLKGAYIASRANTEDQVVQVISVKEKGGQAVSRVFSLVDGKLTDVATKWPEDGSGIKQPRYVRVTTGGLTIAYAPIDMPLYARNFDGMPELFRPFTGLSETTKQSRENQRVELPVEFIDRRDGQHYYIDDCRLGLTEQWPRRQFYLPWTVDDTNCKQVWDVHGYENFAGGVSGLGKKLYKGFADQDPKGLIQEADYYPYIAMKKPDSDLELYPLEPAVEGWKLETYTVFEGRSGEIYLQESRVKEDSEKVQLRVLRLSDKQEMASQEIEVPYLHQSSLHRICSGASDQLAVTAAFWGTKVCFVTAHEGDDGLIEWTKEMKDFEEAMPAAPNLVVDNYEGRWRVNLQISVIDSLPTNRRQVLRQQLGYIDGNEGFVFEPKPFPKHHERNTEAG